jgi:predicted CXXCH cytochrome family protein
MKIIKMLIVPIFLAFILLCVTSPSYSAEENPCVTCHADLKKPAKSVHAAIALGCSSCHKTVEGKNHPAQKGSIILTQSMPGLCYSCHDEAKFKGKSVHQPVSGGMCTGCHDAHQSNFPKLLMKDIPGVCFSCHKESKFKGGKSGHTNIGMCTGCHNPHSSNSDKILLGDQPGMCYNCHDKAKFTKKYVHAIIPAGGCTSCHIPHISEYPALLTSNIQELCLTCHVKKDGRHVVSLPDSGKTKRIHPISGVTDPSTTNMLTVEDPANPKNFKIIADPKNPGKPMNCVSCHDPHSSDFRKLFPTNKLCGKCHKDY